MENICLNHSMYESLTPKHGLVCDPPREVKIEDMLLAIVKIVGFHNIHAASRLNKKVVVFVSEVHMVTPLWNKTFSYTPTCFSLFPH